MAGKRKARGKRSDPIRHYVLVSECKLTPPKKEELKAMVTKFLNDHNPAVVTHNWIRIIPV